MEEVENEDYPGHSHSIPPPLDFALETQPVSPIPSPPHFPSSPHTPFAPDIDGDETASQRPPSPLDANEEVLTYDIYSSVSQDDLRTSLTFIVALQRASLDDPDTGLDMEAIEHLWNPLQCVPSIEDDDMAATIESYLKLSHAESNYNLACEVFNKYRKQGQDDIPSLH